MSDRAYVWTANSDNNHVNVLVSQVHTGTNTNLTAKVGGSPSNGSSVFIPDIGSTRCACFFDHSSLTNTTITSRTARRRRRGSWGFARLQIEYNRNHVGPQAF